MQGANVMLSLIRRFWNDEQGQSLVEYTLIVTFILFTIIGLASGFHSSISGVTNISNSSLASAHSVLH
jgi:Flp pilus assembly pilin Flp